MNNFIKERIRNNSENWSYCFRISTKIGNIIYKTDYQNNIIHNENIYDSSSGYELIGYNSSENGEFNAEIKGFFDQSIKHLEDIQDADIGIYFYFHETKELVNWVELTCTKIIKKDIYFIAKLDSESRKYKNSIVKTYSKRCRAEFGDMKCKVDKNKYPGIECDKSFTMCCKTFNNAINFRGEPFIPSMENFDNDE